MQKKVKNSENLLQKEEFLRNNNTVISTYIELFFENGKIFRADFKNGNGLENLLIMEDVTECKRSNTTFELILQNVNEAVATISPELKVIKYNTEFKEFFLFHEGIEVFSGSLIGNEMEKNKKEFWQNIFSKSLGGEKVSMESRYLTSNDKKHVVIKISTMPVYNSLGIVDYIIVVITDISRIKKYEEDINELKNELAIANGVKNEFMDKINSEIRTPLNSIISGIELLKGLGSDTKTQDIYEIIHDAGENIVTILNDMSDYSNIESGKIKITHEIFQIDKIVSESVEKFRTLADKKAIFLKLNIENLKSSQVFGDALRLKQLISNILSNSLKFTYSGGVEVTFKEESLTASKANYKLIFKDSGVGMEDYELKSAYMTINKIGGTKRISHGLGLFMVEKLSKLLNATVVIKSKKGVGTEVTLEFALERVDDRGNRKKDEKVIAENFSSKKILIVEDNKMNQIVMAKLLKLVNIFPEIAENGAEAVEKLRSNEYDAVLMDIQMPVMNGYDAAKKIREMEIELARERVPIIALTAYAMQSDREKCIEAGMDEYMSKPVIKEELFEVLDKFISK